MSSGRSVVLAALVALSSASCSLSLDRGLGETVSRNECSASSDCGAGECWNGVCVARSSDFSSVLVEVSAPTNTQAYRVGGVRFLKRLTGVSRSTSETAIDLERPAELRGVFLEKTTACGDRPRSFPVEVTFTPREDSYGLPVITYAARTERITDNTRTDCAADLPADIRELDQFSVSVPVGSYDIYVKPLLPAPDAEAPSCYVAPQIFRTSFETSSCLVLPRSEPRKLTVVIPWQGAASGADSLDGWSIDIVHPITGHVLSTKSILSEEDYTETSVGRAYRRTLFYSPVSEQETAKELVRLSPPEGVVAPVIQADRTGLQVASVDATFPSLGPFLPSVVYGGWVEGEGASEGGAQGQTAPVITGRATFTATSLMSVRSGVFASYSTSVAINPSGGIRAEVLPGDYLVRIVPDVGTGFATTEFTIPVACKTDEQNRNVCLSRSAGDKPFEQNGRTFTVKGAATLSGNVVDDVSGELISQVSVHARPFTVTTRRCAAQTEDAACAAAPIGVLEQSLGDRAYTPRAVSGVADFGTFRLTGLDCGECTESSGAVFDVLARPPEASRRAWAVKPKVTVSSSAETHLGDIRLSLPIIHRGVVAIRQSNGPDVVVQDALLRAYILRDEYGERIDDPTNVPSCTAAASSGMHVSRCIRSALQIAEAQAGADGSFELVLPSISP